VAGLIDAGRLMIYCVDGFDAESWFNLEIPVGERTYQHRRCEEWILNNVTPRICKLRWHRGGGDLRVRSLGDFADNRRDY
jgi:esterase/lipase superfamily enzyme